MSPSEKRYFSIDAQRQGDKNKYVDLFKAVNEMAKKGAYDENKLRKRFKGLSDDKAYLYEAILRSMREYRSSRSLTSQVRERLNDARYLYDLGLFQQCEARLQEARNLANQIADTGALLEVNRALRRVHKSFPGKNHEQELADLAVEQEQLLFELNEEGTYLDIFDELLSLTYRYYHIRDEFDRTSLNDKLQEKLSDEQEPASYRARLRFYQSRALLHHLSGERHYLKEDYAKVISIWEENPAYQKEEFYGFVMDFGNLLGAHLQSKEFHRLPPLIERLEKEQPSSQHDKTILFRKLAVFQLITYINNKLPEKLEQKIQAIKKGLKSLPLPIGSQLAIRFNLSILYFITDQYEAAEALCDALIKMAKEKRRDIRVPAMIIKLLACFESGNLQMDNFYRSGLRLLDTEGGKDQYPLEFKALQLFRELDQALPGTEKVIYEHYDNEFERMIREEGIQNAYELDFFLRIWLQSKLTDQKVIDLLHGRSPKGQLKMKKEL